MGRSAWCVRGLESVGACGSASRDKGALWLRHLPVSFVYRMACLNMEWRDARDALLDRRGGLDALLDAFAVGGDEAL